MQMSTGLPLGDSAPDIDEAQTASIAVYAIETDYHATEITVCDAAVMSGQPVVLEASANNADFDQIQFNWRQLTGPKVTITDADSAMISFTTPEVYSTNELIFEVTADDGRNVVSSIVTCTVMAVETRSYEGLHRHSGSFGWLALLFGSLFIGRRKT